MAAEYDTTKQMKAHEGTYSFFLGMMKWGTIASLIVGALVVLIIS